ncbi:MAG TPA: His/Gly/Thr/Pro-type tRNA ligase C-terminal domain-containing protein, partial [Vicinamibacteria bacterium]
SIEALMGDGKALQAGTSHNLGQHFSKAYGIEFLGRNQERLLPWSTSWGTSTRMIGGLIMTHGDDAGLVLPPRVAPHQVVIVPIPPRKGDWNESVLPRAREVREALREGGIRVHLDDRETQQPGFKYADWEMRGVPLRLEIGPKDVEKDQGVLVRRDTRAKELVPTAGLPQRTGVLLLEIQRDLLEKARRFVEVNTTRARTYSELKEAMTSRRGFVLAGWNGDPAVEARIKEETKATIRVIPLEEREAPCVVTGQPGLEVVFAQAY